MVHHDSMNLEQPGQQRGHISGNRTRPALRQFRRRIHWIVPMMVVLSTVITVPAHAVDLSSIDVTADPSVDFNRFANGGWLDRNSIPEDRPQIGGFSSAEGVLQSRLSELLSASAAASGTLPDTLKARGLFAQGLDQQLRDRAGLRPIQPIIDAIQSAKTRPAIGRLLATHAADPFGLISFSVLPGLDDPSRYSLTVNSGSFGLGARDQYLATDADTKKVQQAYVANIAKVLALTGITPTVANRQARAVFDLERRLAKNTLDIREILADIGKVNSPRTVDQLQMIYPELDWRAALTTAGVASIPKEILALDINYVAGLSAITRTTPVATLRAFFLNQLLRSTGSSLSSRLESTLFDFDGRVLGGATTQLPIQRRVLRTVVGALPDAVGQLYVEKHFSSGAKVKITELTKQIIVAFGKRVRTNRWLSPETKARALDKVAKVKIRVGYPDRWESYSEVQLGDSYGASLQAIARVTARTLFAKVGQPLDDSNWGPVTVVNANYDPQNNSINFPAGILQPPFFDANGDQASNYGAIGSIIGHELTHGFDLTGSQFNGDGQLQNWWSDADRTKFNDLNQQAIDQYNAVTLDGGWKVDGGLTVTENVADMGGVATAFDAMQALVGPTATAVDGYTAQQRFFIGFSQAWQEKTRPEYARQLLQVDVHSPAVVRATQPIRNMDEFYAAFPSIKPGTPMYIDPAKRITIW